MITEIEINQNETKFSSLAALPRISEVRQLRCKTFSPSQEVLLESAWSFGSAETNIYIIIRMKTLNVDVMWTCDATVPGVTYGCER